MRKAALMCALLTGWGCGGASATIDGDGGDGGFGSDVNVGDVVGQDVVVSCDGGQVSCGGKCVDTSTDPQNCGGCGVVCNTQCTAGVCPLLGAGCEAGVSPQVGDNACITIDATNVYWATGFNNTGAVWKVPINGGCATQLIGAQAAPHGMASDGTNLFFADQGTFGQSTGSVQSIPINGSAATPIASAQPYPLDVAVDGANVYWTNAGDGSVWKSNKVTPSPIKLAGPNGQNHTGHLSLDSTYVYFTDPAAGTVNRVPIATGSTTTLNTAVTAAGYLAIDSKNAYFGSRGATTSALMSVGLAASNASPNQLVPNLPSIAGIQTDGTSIWFAEYTDVMPYQAGSGEIHRVTVAGTSDTILASKQNNPNCISVDATSVYWINALGGTISKTGK